MRVLNSWKSYIFGGTSNGTATLENWLAIDIHLPYDLVIIILVYTQDKWLHSPLKDMDKHIHGIIILNSHKLEVVQVSINSRCINSVTFIKWKTTIKNNKSLKHKWESQSPGKKKSYIKKEIFCNSYKVILVYCDEISKSNLW